MKLTAQCRRVVAVRRGQPLRLALAQPADEVVDRRKSACAAFAPRAQP
jgi:hypothetical protein